MKLKFEKHNRDINDCFRNIEINIVIGGVRLIPTKNVYFCEFMPTKLQ